MSILTSFVNYMIYLIEKLGYIGIFLVIGLEYACFPIPSEVVLPFVGMSIPQTSLSFLPSFLVSILAGLSGSLICYAIGFYGGEPLLARLSKRSTGLQTALDKFNTWFASYGRWAVLFTRVVPLTRTYISLFAGVSRMSIVEFLLYSATGIALWNLVLMSLGFYVGNNWTLIESLLNTYSNIVLTLVAIVLIGFILLKLQKKQAK
nr:DedA family protein [uncultured Cellulosilyticum sp.]